MSTFMLNAYLKICIAPGAYIQEAGRWDAYAEKVLCI